MKLTKKITEEVEKMKKEPGRKKGINPLVVAAAGMTAGVAVGAGVAAALTDKKTKEKLGRVMGDIRSRVSEYMEKEGVGPKVKRELNTVKKAVVTTSRKRSKN
jgi:hypothetical protein